MSIPRTHQSFTPPPPADGAAPLEHRQFVREVATSPTPHQTKKATVLIRITMPRVTRPLPRAARFIA